MVARAPAAAAVVLLLVGVAALGVCAPAEEGEAAAVTSSAVPAAGAGAEAGAEYTPESVAEPVQTNEDPCLRAGGLCVLESECPPGQLAATRGLCPAQQERGVECCHGLSILERRCSARGGICRPKQKCGRSLWEETAEDCASDETCCVLVS
ncbi:hypothetical protein R5R35_010242 [Gryllus longicercus]|uniref:Uncharacterized protein n=1 Tax=Gryllus longicercus TaxID=2509291 RepID=A0AAN9V800_9ORTH